MAPRFGALFFYCPALLIVPAVRFADVSLLIPRFMYRAIKLGRLYRAIGVMNVVFMTVSFVIGDDVGPFGGGEGVQGRESDHRRPEGQREPRLPRRQAARQSAGR